jgi:hypothetical protein
MIEMEIEYGMSVTDKNNKPLGKIDHIVMDSWSGEPRKFIVRLGDDVSAIYFTPDNVAEVTGKGVKLRLAVEDIERT